MRSIRPLADAGDDVAELWLARWLADCDRLDELRERAGSGSYHASRGAGPADWQAATCWRSCGTVFLLGGSYHAWRELVKRLADRDMDEELRELIASADADTRLLIFEAVGGSVPGVKATRVLADAGHKASRRHLGRLLAREGRLDELRQRAESGDEYAQHCLDEALSQS